MDKCLKLLLASFAAVIPVPATAAYVISFDTASARGTLTNTIDNFSCVPGPCSTSIVPYETLVDGRYASLMVSSLDGLFTYQGADRSRGYYNVNFEFANGTLLSTQLAGFQELGGRCINGPCNQTFTNFEANSFALRLTDQATGSSSLVAPVPEPSTWAMMLLGFLTVGFAMRKRASGQANFFQLNSPEA
jgi:hypothetical protein